MDIRYLIKKGANLYQLPLRVCYYARVSTDHELQATSIVNQVAYFQKYIAYNSCWKLVSGYVDEGISGREVYKREQFLKMILDAKDKKFDLILTKSVSRFARNTVDSIKYTDLLLDYGIGVFFVNDNINTFYSDAEFRLTLMASIAQDEIRKLSESVKFGLRQSIQRGVVLGNSNILGYQKDKGKLILIQNEAQIVKNIYSWFITDKYNFSDIKRLVHNKYQKTIDTAGIKRILTNPKYKGYYCGKLTEVIDYKNNKRRKLKKEDWVLYKAYDKVPPIVTEEVWEKAQQIITKRKLKKLKNQCPYKDLIFCQIHNRKLLYKEKKYKQKRYGYLICPKCCYLSTSLLNRIWILKPFTKILVSAKENDIILKIKLKS